MRASMYGTPMRWGSTRDMKISRGVGGGLDEIRRRTAIPPGHTIYGANTGNVQFRTIFPSWYGGRTPHVHFKVFLAGNEVVASQIFFPEEFNKDVFAQWLPYRDHTSKRTAFNDNDPIKQGIYSEVTRQTGSFSAKAVLVVAQK